jgi:signal transduction histidine kinase
MKISTRLTISIGVTASVLLGISGYIHLSIEEADLYRAMQRETQTLAKSLEVAFENALRDQQLEDVRETITKLATIEDSLDIFLFSPDGHLLISTLTPTAGTEPTLPPGFPFDEVKAGTHIRDGRLYYARALRDSPEMSAHTLITARSTKEIDDDIAKTRRLIILTVLSFILAEAVTISAINTWYLRRPLRHMIAQLDRATIESPSSTNPTAPTTPPALPSVTTPDEIGHAQAAVNSLTRQLQHIFRDLQLRADTRQTLLQNLQNIDKLVTVGQLAAGLAHEIGSPLQVIELRIRALTRSAHDPAETQRVAAHLSAQLTRITKIVSRLLNLAARHVAEVQDRDAAEAVQTVVDLLQHEAHKRQVALTYTPQAPAMRAHCDAHQLQQIALNLTRNALAATDPGGQVLVSLRREGDDLLLAVRDTGHGIDPAVRSRLLEPFFTTRSEEGGTGLGLTIVQALLEERGGTLAITSTPQIGSTFEARIPCAPPAEGTP